MLTDEINNQKRRQESDTELAVEPLVVEPLAIEPLANIEGRYLS